MWRTARTAILVLVLLPGALGGASAAGGDAAGGKLADGKEHSVRLDPVASSGTEGSAVLVPEGRGTRVTVRLAGPRALGARGHVHRGTCDDLGDIVAPLAALTLQPDGTISGSIVVAVPMADLVQAKTVVVYHPSRTESEADVVVACGQIR